MPENSSSVYSKVLETTQHSAIYGLGSMMTRAIGFILMPIYVNYLTPSQYGVYQLLITTLALMIPVFGLGLSSAMFRSYFDFEDEEKRKLVVGSALVTLLLSGIIFAIFGYLCAPYLARIIIGGPGYTNYLRLLLLTGFFLMINEIPLGIIRARKQPKKYITLNISFFTLLMTLIIYNVVVLGQGVWGIITAQFIATISTTFILYFSVSRYISISYSVNEIKRQLVYGIPLIGTMIFTIILNISDKVILNHYTTASNVGIYSVGYLFGMVVLFLFAEPVKMAWPAIMFTSMKDADSKAFYKKAMTYAMVWGIFVFLCVSFFSKELIMILTPSTYWGIYIIVPIVALSYLLGGTIPLLNIGVSISRKTYWLLAFFFIGAFVNIVLNLVFISRFPDHGIMIAALTTLISFIIMTALVFQVNDKLMRIDYERDRLKTLFSMGGILFTVAMIIPFELTYLSVLFKTVLLLVYLSFILNWFMTPGESRLVKVFMKDIFGR